MAINLTQPTRPSASEQRRDDKNRGEISGVDIEIADNGGFIARCNYKPKPTKANKGYDPFSMASEKKVFASKADLVAFLESELPGQDMESADDADEG